MIYEHNHVTAVMGVLTNKDYVIAKVFIQIGTNTTPTETFFSSKNFHPGRYQSKINGTLLHLL